MEEAGTSTHSTVLIITNDPRAYEPLGPALNKFGYSLNVASDPADISSLADCSAVLFVICDYELSSHDADGISVLTKLKETISGAGLILVSQSCDINLGLSAIAAGAHEYLTKPLTADRLLLALKIIEEREHLQPRTSEARSSLNQRYSFSNIIAHSKSMKEIFETVKRLAHFSTTVLITGESGTGKELLARAIHHNSPRRGKPFIAINCGAIPENLMESELFGHKKGAFTDATRDKRGLLEEANGGTVFLDEIGEMPTHLQVKLLRALQEQQIRRVGDEQLISIDVRVIAATLRDLEDDVRTGRFRDDLYYRLNVVSIHLPALRERSDDLPVLVQHFIKKHSKRLNLPALTITDEAMQCIKSYSWPGNVRELENCLERALVLTESGVIDRDALPDKVRLSQKSESDEPPTDFLSDDNLSIKVHTRSLEMNLIRKALKRTRGNRTHAAKVLEISHRALLYKLKEYGLTGD